MEGKSMLKLEEERKEMEMKKMVEQKRREKKEVLTLVKKSWYSVFGAERID